MDPRDVMSLLLIVILVAECLHLYLPDPGVCKKCPHCRVMGRTE